MKANHKEQMNLAEQAAAWLVRLEEDGGPECRRELVAWLKHSPRHLEELLMTAAAYESIDGVDPERRIDIRKLQEQCDAEIVPLQAVGSLTPPTLPELPEIKGAQGPGLGRSPRITRVAAAVAGVAILAAAVWFIFLRGINDQTYTTAVGEQRSVRLADGSIVYLNTHSSVEIHFSSVARDIQLLDGEALFVVTHDIIRPFRVHADSALIQALGTEFNVYKHGRATTVSVIEGRVRVTSQEHAPQSVAAPIQLLAAGEEAQVSQSDVIKRPTRDPAHTIAWRQRQLVFAGDTLAHVFEQVNRYNQTQITIPDPTVAARRLSGVFNVDDLDSLLQFLNGDGDLAFERHGNELIIRSNVAASP